MPSVLIFDSRVWRGMPSFAAALLGPPHMAARFYQWSFNRFSFALLQFPRAAERIIFRAAEAARFIAPH